MIMFKMTHRLNNKINDSAAYKCNCGGSERITVRK